MRRLAVVCLLVLFASPLDAGLRRQCRRECRDDVLRCRLETNLGRFCKRLVLRECRQQGLSRCLPPPPSSTTTSTVTTTSVTDSLPPGVSTTVTVTTLRVPTTRPTATTTLPDLSGLWSFSGYPDEGYDPNCRFDGSRGLALLRLQQGGRLLSGDWGTVERPGSGEILGPLADEFTFRSTREYCWRFCCYDYELDVRNFRNGRGDGILVEDGLCRATEDVPDLPPYCRQVFFGTVERP